MAWITTMLRLGFSACLSGATSGLLMIFAIFFGWRLREPLGAWLWTAPLAELRSLVEFGLTMGILAASLPAFAAGAVMWAAGRRKPAVRGRLAWAAAGAGVAASLWLLFELSFGTPDRGGQMSPAEAGLFAAGLAAGAGGALAFRAAMRFTAFLDEGSA